MKVDNFVIMPDYTVSDIIQIPKFSTERFIYREYRLTVEKHFVIFWIEIVPLNPNSKPKIE